MSIAENPHVDGGALTKRGCSGGSVRCGDVDLERTHSVYVAQEHDVCIKDLFVMRPACAGSAGGCARGVAEH